jgi:hypothetical protein
VVVYVNVSTNRSGMDADMPTLDLYLLPSPGSFSSLTDMRSKRDSRTRVAIWIVNRINKGDF